MRIFAFYSGALQAYGKEIDYVFIFQHVQRSVNLQILQVFWRKTVSAVLGFYDYFDTLRYASHLPGICNFHKQRYF